MAQGDEVRGALRAHDAGKPGEAEDIAFLGISSADAGKCWGYIRITPEATATRRFSAFAPTSIMIARS